MLGLYGVCSSPISQAFAGHLITPTCSDAPAAVMRRVSWCRHPRGRRRGRQASRPLLPELVDEAYSSSVEATRRGATTASSLALGHHRRLIASWACSPLANAGVGWRAAGLASRAGHAAIPASPGLFLPLVWMIGALQSTRYSLGTAGPAAGGHGGAGVCAAWAGSLARRANGAIPARCVILAMHSAACPSPSLGIFVGGIVCAGCPSRREGGTLAWPRAAASTLGLLAHRGQRLCWADHRIFPLPRSGLCTTRT